MKQAIILAAGEGQRLRPFTATKPKVMLTIADKPILGYVIESLAKSGIRKIVLVVGYRKELVYDYFGSGEKLGVEITYVTQERQLGTAHALAQAKNEAEDEFIVLPGDNLIEATTISKFINIKPNAMLVKRVENPVRYGVVNAARGLVKCIVEKPREATNNIINTGIYAFTRDIFAFVDSELNIPDVLNKMLESGQTIRASETDGAWLDVVYPWDVLDLNDKVLRQIPASLGGTIEKDVAVTGTVAIGKDTIIRSNSYIAGPVVIGTGCDIGPNVCIMSSTSIGDNVVVSPFTQIKNSVIGNDVSLGPGCVIQDSVIDKGTVVQGHLAAFSGPAEVKIDEDHYPVTIGAMVGENCRLSHSVVAQPGTVIGNGCQIQAMKQISGRLPDRSLVV